MGERVLISETWYNPLQAFTVDPAVHLLAIVELG